MTLYDHVSFSTVAASMAPSAVVMQGGGVDGSGKGGNGTAEEKGGSGGLSDDGVVKWKRLSEVSYFWNG